MKPQKEINLKLAKMIEEVLAKNPSAVVLEGIKLFIHETRTDLLQRLMAKYSANTLLGQLIDDELETR